MTAYVLPSGHSVLVDAEDLPLLEGYRWRLIDKGTSRYAAARQPGTRTRNVYMHRLILGVTDRSVHVDHRNGDGLDNRRANLRIATASQNQANRRNYRSNGLSRFKGVTFSKKLGRWLAYIKVHGEHRNLGFFDDEEEAARAYDAAAREAFGEFACTNADLGLLEAEAAA